MSNLLNFFFSFDKLMKEKLVIPFFWLGLIVIGLVFFADALSAIRLSWIAGFVEFINFFARLLLAIIGWRLLAEICVAIFRINNNLAPDGGASETADIDIMEEAKHAAEAAVSKTRDVAKSAGEATKSAVNKTRSGASDLAHDIEDAAEDVVEKAKRAAPKRKAAPKKTTAKKPAAKASGTTTRKKPGPKPGTKAKRDADGNLLKKDGTPRKKPGPKPK